MKVPPFNHPQGPIDKRQFKGSAHSIFLKLFPEDLLDHIVKETNKYARAKFRKKADKAGEKREALLIQMN